MADRHGPHGSARPTEAWVVIAVAIVVFLVSGADLLGVLDQPWFSDRIPTITLLLVSALLGFVALELVTRLRSIHDEIGSLQNSVTQERIERVLELRRGLAPALDAVFGDLVDDLIRNLKTAIAEHTITFESVALFRLCYTRTQQHPDFKNAEFWANRATVPQVLLG
jgi:hypothetical protein